MTTKETRSIWLVTKDGKPHHCAWGAVKTFAEAASFGKRQSWAAALGPKELPADGWDATLSNWRRAPRLLQPGVTDKLANPPRVEGREVVLGGCRISLDDRGRAHPQGADDDPREPLVPDSVVENEDELLAAAEVYGSTVNLVEKGTLRRICVQPAPDADAPTRPDGVDVLIFRDKQSGQRRRLAAS